jgi:hypothetical protein
MKDVWESLNIKWCGNVCKWGHFGASGLRGSERLEYKEHGGEPKGVDPEFSLSLSLFQILIKYWRPCKPGHNLQKHVIYILYIYINELL